MVRPTVSTTVGAGLAALAAVVLAGCNQTVAGAPTAAPSLPPSIFEQTTVTAPAPEPVVQDATMQRMDGFVDASTEFWNAAYGLTLDLDAVADTEGVARVCVPPASDSLAWVCPDEGIVGYDHARVTAALNGDGLDRTAVLMAAAHEVGHAAAAAFDSAKAEGEFGEDIADCLSGVYAAAESINGLTRNAAEAGQAHLTQTVIALTAEQATASARAFAHGYDGDAAACMAVG